MIHQLIQAVKGLPTFEADSQTLPGDSSEGHTVVARGVCGSNVASAVGPVGRHERSEI